MSDLRASLQASQLADQIGSRVRCADGEGILTGIRWSNLAHSYRATIALGNGDVVTADYRFVEVLPDEPPSFDEVAELAREILG